MKKKANNISKEQALEIQNKILKETIKQLKIDKSNLEKENANLKAQLARKYRRTSEAISSDQLLLFNEAEFNVEDGAAALVLFPTILLVLYISTSNVVNSGPPPKIKIIENEVKQYRNIKRNDDIREGNILTRVIEKKVLSLDAPSSCDEYS